MGFRGWGGCGGGRWVGNKIFRDFSPFINRPLCGDNTYRRTDLILFRRYGAQWTARPSELGGGENFMRDKNKKWLVPITVNDGRAWKTYPSIIFYCRHFIEHSRNYYLQP